MSGRHRKLASLARLLALEGGVVVIGLLFTVVVNRIMGIDSYGQIAYALAIGNILSTAVRYGTDETLIVSMMRANNQRLEIVAVTLLRACLCGIAVGLLSVLWLGAFVTGKEAVAVACFLLLGLQVVAQFDYFDEQHKHSYTLIGNKATLLLVFAGLASTTDLSALNIFSIASVIANIGLLCLHYRYFKANIAGRHPEVAWSAVATRMKELLFSNHVVMFASMMSLGLYSANQLYIKFALSFEALAIFSMQWQVCNVFTIYMKRVNRIYKPTLAAQYRDNSSKLRGTQLKFLALVTLPPTLMSLLIWLNYDDIFPRLFSNSLAGYGNVYLLLTIFIFLRGIHLTLTQISFVASKNHVAFTANVVGVALIGAVIVILKGYDQIEDGVIAMNIAILGMIFVTGAMLWQSPSRKST